MRCAARRLAKDPSRWGVVEGDNSVSLFYVLHAPWCNARRDVPEELKGHIPPYDRPPHVSNWRMPAGGNCHSCDSRATMLSSAVGTVLDF
jgi:hypothetical protein